MRIASRVGGARSTGSMLAFVLLLGSIAIGVGSSDDRRPSGDRPAAVPTVEPLPGLGLELRVTTIEQTVRGGIASLSLETTSSVPAGVIELAVHLPPHVFFIDGSAERSWQVALETGGRSEIPFELLIDRPGRLHLSAEAIGTFHGRSIHRGISLQLIVGQGEPLPDVIDGAIEHSGRIVARGGRR